MRIGIVGADARGVHLAQMLLRAGHSVTLSDPLDPGRALRAVRGITAGGVQAVEAAEQARACDVLVFEVRSQEMESAVRAFGRVDGPIVVETSRPAADGTKPSVAETLVERLGTARIVKTFTDNLEPGDAVLVASDDTDAKATVSELITAIGMRPVDAGPLKNARKMESAAHTQDPLMQ